MVFDRLPGRGPGAIFVLAETCQTVQTHFLSWASKKENALQKKEDAKENLLGKFFSGRFPKTEGPRPLRLPWSSIFAVQFKSEAAINIGALSFFILGSTGLERFRTIRLPSSKCQVLNRRRANFLWKFLFAGACGGERSLSVTDAAPLTRTFAEQKCLVTAKDRRFAARQSNRCTRNKIRRNRKTERECLRNRKHSLFFSALLIENPRDSKRAAALLFPARQREKSNFFLAARHRASLRS